MAEPTGEKKIAIGQGSTDPRYRVGKIPQHDTKEVELDPLFPIHPFLALSIGPRHTGKTNMLVDFLTNKYPPDFWDVIVIYCKTFYDDGKWALIGKMVSDDMVRTKFTEESLIADYETISLIVQEKPDFRSLIIFDDMIADNISSKMKIDTIGLISVMGRHKGISLWVNSQVFRALAPAVRNNATNVFCFGTTNNLELKKISEECRGGLSVKEFQAIYDTIFRGDDSRFVEGERPFLHVNNAKPLSQRFWMGWDHPILIDGLDTAQAAQTIAPTEVKRKRGAVSEDEDEEGDC